MNSNQDLPVHRQKTGSVRSGSCAAGCAAAADQGLRAGSLRGSGWSWCQTDQNLQLTAAENKPANWQQAQEFWVRHQFTHRKTRVSGNTKAHVSNEPDREAYSGQLQMDSFIVLHAACNERFPSLCLIKITNHWPNYTLMTYFCCPAADVPAHFTAEQNRLLYPAADWLFCLSFSTVFATLIK